ncbi:MAG: hypothetical protein A2Y62_04900 [Candidatus Fischerbacteria bacterium RBG_13_37_8]|uniref:Peptidase n=1 Tax=Candidatus Fischerbacteria bacterium RBG_13_37_8 TaxID=1817863 RepID=A0A1F5VIC3_9BACT|nr:MAG: hypothetical protein A2Y62_04900 [Candidatus Fischerbacteria bacterium RBG_13_37_8]
MRGQIKKFATVEISFDEKQLTMNEMQVIKYLVKAAQEIDKIFLLQVSPYNFELQQKLVAAKTAEDKVYAEYFSIQYGPWDRLEEEKLFIPWAEPEMKPLGANFYPADMKKEEFENWVKDHPEDKDAFLSPYTIIMREEGKLKAVPYSVAYKKYLEPASEYLKNAAKYADAESLKKFLLSRADAFLTNDYYQSDIDWMELDSKIEVTIGPYEVYEDRLLGYKAAFEAYVTLNLPGEAKKLERYKDLLPEMEKALPLPKDFQYKKRAMGSPIVVVNEIFTGGDARPAVQSIAFNLPNDEKVRELKGSKKVMLMNIMGSKFNKLLMPISELVLTEKLRKGVAFNCFFNHVLMHELAHAQGPGYVIGTDTTVSEALRDLHAPVEEGKADVIGMHNILYLMENDELPAKSKNNYLATLLAGMFRSFRFGATEAHAVGTIIQFNYLVEKGVILFNTKDGKYELDFSKADEAIISLAKEFLILEAEGNYDKAKEFVDRYGKLSDRELKTLKKLEGIPVDIRPVFMFINK